MDPNGEFLLNMIPDALKLLYYHLKGITSHYINAHIEIMYLLTNYTE